MSDTYGSCVLTSSFLEICRRGSYWQQTSEAEDSGSGWHHDTRLEIHVASCAVLTSTWFDQFSIPDQNKSLLVEILPLCLHIQETHNVPALSLMCAW